VTRSLGESTLDYDHFDACLGDPVDETDAPPHNCIEFGRTCQMTDAPVTKVEKVLGHRATSKCIPHVHISATARMSSVHEHTRDESRGKRVEMAVAETRALDQEPIDPPLLDKPVVGVVR
jgi:hypothetical protein